MNILMLPNDMRFYITRFSLLSDKINMRETCIELKNSISFIDIRIEKFNSKFEQILTGRIYILSRLRLAALCGLHEHTVANIWSWVSLVGDIKSDALPILRQIGNAICKNILP